MEDLGIERVHSRPIKLFQLSDWTWDPPRADGFTLLVAAQASPEKEIAIQRFARDAVVDGCGYVCAWGLGCENVHDLFDIEAIAADRFVMSTWHSDEELHEALYFALILAFSDEDEFPEAGESAVVLAVEEPWITEVRRLVADQDELARLWVTEDE